MTAGDRALVWAVLSLVAVMLLLVILAGPGRMTPEQALEAISRSATVATLIFVHGEVAVIATSTPTDPPHSTAGSAASAGRVRRPRTLGKSGRGARRGACG